MRILKDDELYTGMLARPHFSNCIYELGYISDSSGQTVYREIDFINGVPDRGEWEYSKHGLIKWFETDITRNLNLQKIREEKLKLLGF